METKNNKTLIFPLVLSAVLFVVLSLNEAIKKDVQERVLSVIPLEVLTGLGLIFGASAILALVPLVKNAKDEEDEARGTVAASIIRGSFYLLLWATCITISNVS